MSSGSAACAPGARRKPPASGGQREKLTGGGERRREGPCLINLLDNIDRAVVDRMKPDGFEFHRPRLGERVAGLPDQPLPNIVRQLAHARHQGVSIRNGLDDGTASFVSHASRHD